MRALAKDPADRYPSVAEFAAALRVAAGVPEGATTTPEAVAPSLPEPATSASIPSRGTTSDGRLVTGTTTRTVPITRRVSPVRLLVTVVSALGLLIAIAGGSVLVAQRQGEVSAQATRTAAAATTAPTATSTALANAAIVTCAPGTTEAIGLPLTCSPVPPTAVGTPLLADPLPLCDGVGGGWQLESNANRACLPEGLQISPIDASANALACADARTVMMADGFASVRVHWQSGGVALAFRESLGSTTTASGTLIAGYYFLVYPASGHGQPDTYELTALDGAGGSRVIGSAATLAAPLAGDFVLGVAYHGGGFTLYVNGQSLATLTNSTRATGWFGVCTLRGTSIFRDAQVFPQAS